ncbi:MAG: hypothetical protein ICV86_00345 [Microcoleus sp. T3-bin5]|nr:hypothetical protein [Microcoleus sp. T3-bin5]
MTVYGVGLNLHFAPFSKILKKPGNGDDRPTFVRESAARNRGDDIGDLGVRLN